LDAYQHPSDGERVENDFEEISSTNARLEDLRDATTRLRGLYEKAWLRENRPYWLGNVLVRYDNLADKFQTKIVTMRDAQRHTGCRRRFSLRSSSGFFLQPPITERSLTTLSSKP